MTNFSQVMHDWRRMCNKMDEGYEVEACLHCPLTLADATKRGCDAIYTNWAADVDWDKIASIVEEWAAKNPEPVYPTWYEYVWSQLTKKEPISDHDLATWMENNRIPADIAEKLGLKPKERKNDV